MAINTTLKKKMPTGDGNPTAGAINGLDFATAQQRGKAFVSLSDAFALRGHILCRTAPTDGPETYWVERWGLVRHLPAMHDVALFLAQIGGRL